MYQPLEVGDKPIVEPPRLEVRYKQKLQEFHDAEFDGNQALVEKLRQELDVIEFKMSYGEEFDPAF